MLVLKVNGQTVKPVAEGGMFTLPNGDTVSPAYAGWAEGAYSLVFQPDPVPEPPTPAQIQAAFTEAIDGHIEAKALAWSYNSAAHLASYAPSTVPQWAAEAAAFVAWRDQVWLAALALLGSVQAGGAMPASPEAFIATLPALARP